MTDDLSRCCAAWIDIDPHPVCSACGKRQTSEDLLDRVETMGLDVMGSRVPGDARDLEEAATSPIEWTSTGRQYRSAVHALWAYLRARADGAKALELSPQTTSSMSGEAAYARDVHEARELERIFMQAHEGVIEHLDKGEAQWQTWGKVRLDGQSMRDVEGRDRTSVTRAVQQVDGWIEWTLDEWGKYDGSAPRPVGLGGEAPEPDPDTTAMHGDDVVRQGRDEYQGDETPDPKGLR